MTATWALILDAYRDLNSKKLFWLTMIISGIIVLGFAAVGIDESGLSVLWWKLGDFNGNLNSNTVPRETFYKSIFSQFGITFWLAWGASILALVSTAGLIPSFVQGGAVELVLSKPIARVRLFLTKFACGLLFSALQVAVFSLASFLVIGLRGNSWEPSVFWAVPLVVIFFSYLYSICALIGLLTRSTIAALLLTMVAWFGLFVINATDAAFITLRETNQMNIERIEKSVEKGEKFAIRQWQQVWITQQSKQLPEGSDVPVPPVPSTMELDDSVPSLAENRRDLENARSNQRSWEKWFTMVVGVKTLLPKTGETIGLLERTLDKEMALTGRADDEDEDEIANQPPGKANKVRFGERMSKKDERELGKRVELRLRSRSVWWVLGTSLMFEAVILTIACWVFAKRDF